MHITHVLLDNAHSGKITKEQRAGEFDVWQTVAASTPTSPRTPELCGALGLAIADRSALDDTLSEALAHHGPALVHVHADVALV